MFDRFRKPIPAPSLDAFLESVPGSSWVQIDYRMDLPALCENTIPVRYQSVPSRGRRTSYDEALGPVLVPYVAGQEVLKEWADALLAPLFNQAVAFSDTGDAKPVLVQSRLTKSYFFVQASEHTVRIGIMDYRGLKGVPPLKFPREEI